METRILIKADSDDEGNFNVSYRIEDLSDGQHISGHLYKILFIRAIYVIRAKHLAFCRQRAIAHGEEWQDEHGFNQEELPF